MLSIKQAAQILLCKSADSCKLLTYAISNAIISAKWEISDHYKDLAPVIKVRILEIGMKLKPAVLFDQKASARIRARYFFVYTVGAAAILALTIAPANAIFQLYQQEAEGSEDKYHAQTSGYLASDVSIAAERRTSFGSPSIGVAEDTEYADVHIMNMPMENIFIDFDYKNDEPEDLGDFAGGVAKETNISKLSEFVVHLKANSGIITLADAVTDLYSEYDRTEPINHEVVAEVVPNAINATIGTVVSSNYVSQRQADEIINNGEDEQIFSTASTGVLIWPAEGKISSLFGPRNSSIGSRIHKGLDINGSSGSQILAADGGEVIKSGWSNSFGWYIRILHDDGSITLYSHNLENFVSVGQRVSQGQVIASMGRTGRTTGVNLHFEVIIDGVNVNPLLHLPYVQDRSIVS